MAQGSLAPHWVEIQYTTNALAHTMKIAVNHDPFAVPGQITFTAKDGSNIQWVTAVTAFADVVKPLLAASDSSIDRALFWEVNQFTNDVVLRDAVDLNIAGTALGTATEGSQSTYSFVDAGGKGLRIVLLESIAVPHYRLPYGDLGASGKALVDYVNSPTTWIWSRNEAYPKFFLRNSCCFNDSLTRKRFGVS